MQAIASFMSILFRDATVEIEGVHLPPVPNETISGGVWG